MRLAARLSLPQRWVIVVALAAAADVAGSYFTSLGGTVTFGWYAYAPLAPGAGPRPGLAEWERLLIWLALIALWAVLSVLLLRPARTTAT